jgi:polyphosphate kinase 2 PPK2
MLSHTSTEWAPWHVIPADRKWFARIGAGAVLVHALMEIDPHFPTVTEQQRQALNKAKEELEAQAPTGAVPDPFEQQRDAKAEEGESDGGQLEPPAADATNAADKTKAERRAEDSGEKPA